MERKEKKRRKNLEQAIGLRYIPRPDSVLLSFFFFLQSRQKPLHLKKVAGCSASQNLARSDILLWGSTTSINIGNIGGGGQRFD